MNGVTCSSFKGCLELIKEQISETIGMINEDSIRAMIDAIMDADKIFLLGAGRSGLVAKAFA
ncbi:MAG TPA: 6-phospho-3-hexuloisomerase, partial [Candidatus Syntrophoarchaeum butanivorans]|nr:6-phospho-3-hexuloisomerase [Candidatus Syntrophoarchaeum butanivorans]